MNINKLNPYALRLHAGRGPGGAGAYGAGAGTGSGGGAAGAPAGTFLLDTFSSSSAQDLDGRTGEIGAEWSYNDDTAAFTIEDGLLGIGGGSVTAEYRFAVTETPVYDRRVWASVDAAGLIFAIAAPTFSDGPTGGNQIFSLDTDSAFSGATLSTPSTFTMRTGVYAEGAFAAVGKTRTGGGTREAAGVAVFDSTASLLINCALERVSGSLSVNPRGVAFASGVAYAAAAHYPGTFVNSCSVSAVNDSTLLWNAGATFDTDGLQTCAVSIQGSSVCLAAVHYAGAELGRLVLMRMSASTGAITETASFDVEAPGFSVGGKGMFACAGADGALFIQFLYSDDIEYEDKGAVVAKISTNGSFSVSWSTRITLESTPGTIFSGEMSANDTYLFLGVRTDGGAGVVALARDAGSSAWQASVSGPGNAVFDVGGAADGYLALGGFANTGDGDNTAVACIPDVGTAGTYGAFDVTSASFVGSTGSAALTGTSFTGTTNTGYLARTTFATTGSYTPEVVVYPQD